MNKVYERMALSLIEDIKAPKPKMEVAKEEPTDTDTDTDTLHARYEALKRYMEKNHPGVPYPPGPGKDIEGAKKGVKIAGSISHSKFTKYISKKGKNK